MNSVSIGVLPVKYVVNIYPRLVTIGNDTEAADHSGSTNPYHIFRRPGTNHWWIWFGLPNITTLRIWVGPSGLRPLPTFTTAATRLTSNQIHHIELDSRAGWPTVIRVDNVENRRNHPEWWHGGGRHRKENFRIIRPVGL